MARNTSNNFLKPFFSFVLVFLQVIIVFSKISNNYLVLLNNATRMIHIWYILENPHIMGCNLWRTPLVDLQICNFFFSSLFLWFFKISGANFSPLLNSHYSLVANIYTLGKNGMLTFLKKVFENGWFFCRTVEDTGPYKLFNIFPFFYLLPVRCMSLLL